MSKWAKRIEKWRVNPRDIRYEEVHAVPIGFGFEFRGSEGGHFHYTREGHRLSFRVHRGTLHSLAVKEIVRRLDELTDEG
jgi:hypothetical protein